MTRVRIRQIETRALARLLKKFDLLVFNDDDTGSEEVKIIQEAFAEQLERRKKKNKEI